MAHEPPPSIVQQVQQGHNLYGLIFKTDEGETWSEAEQIVVLRAVAAVDRRLRIAGRFAGSMPGNAFRKVFGSITMLRSAKTQWTDNQGNTHEITYGAETFGSRIEFYDPAVSVNPLDPKFRNNVVHELGHAFNAATVKTTNGKVNPYNDLIVALGEGELRHFRFNPRDGMEPSPWQQHSDSNATGELFADYFLNWTYGRFRSNAAGTAQSKWMSSQMGLWLRR